MIDEDNMNMSEIDKSVIDILDAKLEYYQRIVSVFDPSDEFAPRGAQYELLKLIFETLVLMFRWIIRHTHD